LGRRWLPGWAAAGAAEAAPSRIAIGTIIVSLRNISVLLFDVKIAVRIGMMPWSVPGGEIRSGF
jgi:hypothetical protein